MAEIRSLQALRYELAAVGSLDAVIAPPYDVIDDDGRAELAARSPFNVVEIDLPRAAGDEDPYLQAAATMHDWIRAGVLRREREPTLWALAQEYTAPDGRPLTRRGFFARVRVEDYGAGRIRPHERTHPGPREDRLRLTRATRANLSPIFSLYEDHEATAWSALEWATGADPFAVATEAGGTVNRLWRVDDRDAIEAVRDAMRHRELLIADGHHRYETARVYADEVGGDGDHRYVLMLLCSLSDPGLIVFPTHRLLSGLDPRKQEALRDAALRDFHVEPVDADGLEPPAELPGIVFGYMDSHFKQPYRLTLKDRSIADSALRGKPDAYRRLDTAVLEALVLRGALGMSEHDIAELRGLAYSSDFSEARSAVEGGRVDAAFFLRGTPIQQVHEVAATGESMPPKSTYFFPKVPTGLVFNPLE